MEMLSVVIRVQMEKSKESVVESVFRSHKALNATAP